MLCLNGYSATEADMVADVAIKAAENAITSIGVAVNVLPPHLVTTAHTAAMRLIEVNCGLVIKVLAGGGSRAEMMERLKKECGNG